MHYGAEQLYYILGDGVVVSGILYILLIFPKTLNKVHDTTTPPPLVTMTILQLHNALFHSSCSCAVSTHRGDHKTPLREKNSRPSPPISDAMPRQLLPM